MRRIKASDKISVFSLLALFWLFMWPWPAAARVAEKPPIKEPFERVVFKQGPWGTEYMDIEGQTRLIVKKLEEWERKQEAGEGGEEGKGVQGTGEVVTLGNEKLIDAIMEPEKNAEQAEVSAGEAVAPSQRKPVLLKLDQDRAIETIVLNTFNRGQGAPPGKIQVMDAQNKVIAELHPTGTTLGGVPKGAWVVHSNMRLSAGTYTLRAANPEALA